MKKIQIGVIGSAADLNYSDEAESFAKELGKLIAKSGNILVYGAEKEYISLSTNAAISVGENNGITVDTFGGWAKQLSGKFIDDRKRIICENAKTPEEALNKVIAIIRSKEVDIK